MVFDQGKLIGDGDVVTVGFKHCWQARQDVWRMSSVKIVTGSFPYRLCPMDVQRQWLVWLELGGVFSV